MATTGPRFSAPIPAESKANDFPVDLAAALAPFEAAAVKYLVDVQGNRPAPGLVGRVFYASDWLTQHPSSPAQWDTGSAWVDLVPAKPFTVPFFVAGAFGVGSRPARWIAPEPCVLSFAYAVLTGGTASSSCRYALLVNNSPGASSPILGNTAGVAKYDFTDVACAAGDVVQLSIAATTNTPADLSVTVAGRWTGLAA